MENGFYATDKLLRKEFLFEGKPSKDLNIALKQYFEREKDGGVTVEEITIYAVDVVSREILGSLGTIGEFMKKSRIDWKMISKFPLQKGSYIKYKKSLDWEVVASNSSLSMEMLDFLEDYIDKANIKSHFDRFSEEYLLKHLDEWDKESLILDRELPVSIIEHLSSNEQDFYLHYGRVDLKGFQYILKEAFFKGQLFKDITDNPKVDISVLLKYSDKLDWESANNILYNRELTDEDFWLLYPHAKNCGVLETCILTKELSKNLFTYPIEDFDYEQFILNNQFPIEWLEDARFWLEDTYSKQNIDALLILSTENK